MREGQGRRQEFQKGGAISMARKARREIFRGGGGHALLGRGHAIFRRFDRLINKYFSVLI